ncbi:MAG: hypothetical protein EHM64_04940 [Ignavibacteriae bacterium]|nr:MAG: hypothetical protein EHM64_04940 [Ignavibacteriota bacterium]
MKRRFLLSALIGLVISQGPLAAQDFGFGSSIYRARNTHAGNLVRMTFSNNGRLGSVKGDNSTTYNGEWPIGSGHVQMGNVSAYVMSEIRVMSIDPVTHDTSYKWITPAVWCEGWDPDLFPHAASGRFQGFEPLPGFLNTTQKEKNPMQAVAMSHQSFTWPPFWPDKTADAINPGWGSHWNGYFGKDQQNADQESYYVMDDYQADIKSQGIAWPKPVSVEPLRGGLGLRMSVRGLQWSNPDAEDCIFFLYDIHNFGSLNLDKSLFGTNVGASSGGLVMQSGDYNDDAAQFYREKSLAVNHEDYSSDPNNPGLGGYTPVPWVGFAFLESPGNPYDGIDNDGDGSDVMEPGGGTGKIITTADFWKTYNVGDTVITIDYNSPNYTRIKRVMPHEGIRVQYRGFDRVMKPNVPLQEVERDGVDNNLNGLIDENDGAVGQDSVEFYLYIRSASNNRDYLSKDYFTGDGLSNLMIDERRDDGLDNDGDWNPQYDDVGMDGKPGTGDKGEGDGAPTSGAGTDLPGESNVDKTDVDESDQIGLTSFKFYEYSKLTYSSEEQMWTYSQPGYFDNKTTTIGDYDYVFSSGYFPLRSGTREFLSMALVYGIDEIDIIRNKDVVQTIYNANYNFAIAPIKPTVKAVAGNKQVILTWDDNAEMSFDRFLREYDFEGYKIYKSTDYTFADAGTITDGLGYDRFKKPLAIYDKIDSMYGYFPKDIGNKGVLFNLGNESGLAHKFVDGDVTNGMRYFYAVTAYDRGNILKNIAPSECSITVNADANGEIQYSENVISVIPHAPTSGYVNAGFDITPTLMGDAITKGTVGVSVVNPELIRDGDEYEIQFLDQSMDHHDNNGNGLVDGADPLEWLPTLTTGFVLKNLSAPRNDTTWFYNYIELKKDSVNKRLTDSTYLLQNLYDDNDKDSRTVTQMIGGLEISVYNPPGSVISDSIRDIVQGTHWGNALTVAQSYPIAFGPFTVPGYKPGISFPRQYKIVFYNNPVDTSLSIKLPLLNGSTVPMPAVRDVKFHVFDLLTGEKVKFAFADTRKTGSATAGQFSAGDRIILFEKLPNDSTVITYQIYNAAIQDTSFFSRYGRLLGDGDTLYLYSDNPFTSQIRYHFKLRGQKIDQAAASNELSRIRVVPNPYAGTAVWETRNAYSSGRGPRKVEFIHLPHQCTIRIYTVDGTLVRTLEHNTVMADGAEPWDLMSKENMSISYGVYLYHIDAPGIGEHIGKIFIIK